MVNSENSKKISFSVTGMTCATCARIVERSLKKVDGVVFAGVNLATETAFVVLEKEVPMEKLEEAVKKAGYEVSYEPPEDLDRRRYEEAKRNLVISWGITLPLMVLMFMHMTGFHMPWFPLMEFIGGAVVLFGAGRATMKGAWIALSHLHANMDVLVSLGALAAWLTSLLVLAGVKVASFGAIGAMIIALHVTGRFIESHLRDRASKEIKSLLEIQAREARILDESGKEISVPIEAVKEDFTLIIRPGERIPADGMIIEGATSVDESMITGESIPVHKEVEGEVTGGSLNLTGSIKVKATKVGEDSFLSQMIALIQEAQGAKIPIQAFADRVTNYFVPAVATFALISGFFWYFGIDRFSFILDAASHYLPWVTSVREPLSIAIFGFISTLVIACPCALGLATPMALITGTGAASKKGLVIRNAEAIQTAKEVGVVLMDKTGTITQGSPSVVETNLSNGDLEAVAALEKHSIHPLAKAVAAVTETTLEPRSMEEITGEGVKGVIREDSYFIGKPQDSSKYKEQLSLGRTVVEVRKNNVVVGFIAIEDPLRNDAIRAVERLKELGIIPVMVTGDNERTARAVAKRVGIESVYAGVRPDEKLSILRDFQTSGKKVLMVGDGMNDAAALKGADIGVAIGSGTDLAIDSADIVVVRGGISSIADAVDISRQTFTVIRQNLFWAFAYNVIAIPLAMGALLHPAIAETAMAFSSISVILNSMRIRVSK
ncbi:MAG: heavy metal translocating P-type ATPase [Aminobacterium sp.]